jgi:hypothetical protein
MNARQSMGCRFKVHHPPCLKKYMCATARWKGNAIGSNEPDVFSMEKMMKNIMWLKSISVMQGAGLMAACALFVASCASIPAPTEQMASSRAAVAEATNAGSSEYAPAQLKAALEKMGGAEQAMSEKNYEQARSLAEQAQVDAQLALATARAAKARKAAAALHEDDRVLREEMNRNAK